MSGGKFYGADTAARDTIFQYSNEPINVFEDKEISELVWDVFDLIRSLDYYECGDTSEETYLNDKADFKKKWLGGNRDLRIRKIVDEAIENLGLELYGAVHDSIEELKQGLYETFGLKGEE